MCMNTALHPVAHHSSEDADFACSACGRWVKRAVTLSDGRMLGMDCAATAMGRARSRSVYAQIEIDALRATAEAAGRSFAKCNPRPRRDAPAFRAWVEIAANANPYPINSFQYHAFAGAL